MANIVPFGKYKGKSVEALLDDREYLDWLLQQGWFQQRYGNLYQIVINNGVEPSETPEHNAMQIRFLDEEYRLKFACASNGQTVFALASNKAIQECWKQIEATKIAIENKIAAQYAKKMEEFLMERSNCSRCQSDDSIFAEKFCWHHRDNQKPYKQQIIFPAFKAHGRRTDENNLASSTSSLMILHGPFFEASGCDVVYSIKAGFELSPDRGHIESSKNRWVDYAEGLAITLPETWKDFEYRIEIKPSIGDDFPAVLRQINRNKANCLLVRFYTGIGATQEQFIQFFESQGIKVIFEADVDAVVLPQFDKTIEAQEL